MALDMAKMRAKMDKLQNKGNGGGGNRSQFWRPEDGDQTIRILPTADGDPFKTFFFHYNLGKNAGFLSPKRNFGEDDPLNDFVSSLFQEGTPESTDLAKKLMAKQRFFSPVLVRGEEDKGPRIWGYGKQVYEQLLNLVLNPEYGDITDVNSGTDLHLNYGKPPGASFPKTQLTPARKESSLCAEMGEQQCSEMLDNIPDFDGLFERKSPQDVQRMLDEYLASGNAEELSSETEYGTKGSSSVENAFKELMG